MATTKLYLDDRKSQTNAPIKLVIHHGGQSSHIHLGVRISSNQWDVYGSRVIRHPNKNALNAFITSKRLEVDEAILELMKSGKLKSMTAKEIRDRIVSPTDGEPSVLFKEQFEAFVSTKKGGTASIYRTTYNRISAFCDIDSLTFEDINRDWLLRFDAFMAETAPSKNARNIHLRNIRAVFNYALDNELITCYPFRRFKITPEATRKRSLGVEQLRLLFSYDVEPWQQEYLDIFKLIFFLVGINIVDLAGLTEITADGRVEYRRAKTHRLYSIKVEHEAREVIEKYKGKGHLLNILDGVSSYRTYCQHMNKALQKIGPVVKKPGRGGPLEYQPLFPDLTTYWARHSWATIAASLDIPKETIAAALGHSMGNPTTAIYIDFDQKKVDEANRRVIDWVLYGKK